jgi:hypothetical protein
MGGEPDRRRGDHEESGTILVSAAAVNEEIWVAIAGLARRTFARYSWTQAGTRPVGGGSSPIGIRSEEREKPRAMAGPRL